MLSPAYPGMGRADRLLFNILWTTWIVIAAKLEERNLVCDFGDQYREYQARVPMIIPYRFPRMPG
jgi:methanethiol S-methyltransferase